MDWKAKEKRVKAECEQVKRSRQLTREDKAALTMGRLTGRASLKQVQCLARMGLDSAKTMNWTRYRAAQEIARRLSKDS